MIENLLRPEVLLSNVVVCLATFLITRWAIKRKEKPQQRKEVVQAPKRTADGWAVLEASLATLQSYKKNLNTYGYAYFQETTPIVVKQLKAEAGSLIPSESNKAIPALLEENYETLEGFQQRDVSDTKKLELEVLNHVNKTIITWRNLLKESR
ncbi:hypothetical protein P7D97_12210 [Enterococcus raffinosus]|jgi:hypothetical protein|uniref:hypothetical protein n=1 Tax=Enterococcus raffinosus TaxID=71452 RepID=UPI001C455D1F|nr:hypothetical protein [Enterococcus raffinosus]MDT2572371.1 hypothetical protein [Enterococcus raffinosus]QXJ61283.1 hypothetical protein J9537_14895 [Enterococcus raffinosus]